MYMYCCLLFFTCLAGDIWTVIGSAMLAKLTVGGIAIALLAAILYCWKRKTRKCKTRKGEPGLLYSNSKILCFLFLHVYNFPSPMHG